MSSALQRFLLFFFAVLSASAAVGSYYVDPQQQLLSWQVCFAAMVVWVVLAMAFCYWAATSSRETL